MTRGWDGIQIGFHDMIPEKLPFISEYINICLNRTDMKQRLISFLGTLSLIEVTNPITTDNFNFRNGN